MSLLREVKPRNARTARIVKSREPQQIEDRKRVLLLHGSKCPLPVNTVLKTVNSLTKPHSVMLTKKNADIHPFEDPASLEFLAGKNDCGLVVFGTHSKKRPNNVTFVRIFDGKVLDMVELLVLTTPEQLESEDGKLQVGVEMKPMVLFVGSQWDDASVSEQAALYRTTKSLLLDVFQGEEIASIDVAGLQYVLMVAAGESTGTSMEDPLNRPVLHLRWYRVKTMRSQTPKIPRVELDQVGPSLDFRVGRSREADISVMKEAMKHGRKPNEARTKKNVETDLVGDQLGRVHLGKQDLSTLQTRKMKGLKRGRDDDDDEELIAVNRTNGNVAAADLEGDDVSDDEEELGGMEVEDGDEDDLSEGSSIGGTGDEIDIGDSDQDEDDEDLDDDEQADVMPKRQRTA